MLPSRCRAHPLRDNQVCAGAFSNERPYREDLTSQLAQLNVAGCEKVFREKMTGTNADRPQLRKLMPPSPLATW